MMRVELVALTLEQNELRLLAGPHGLPSCPAGRGQSLDRAARRLLDREVHADHSYLEQLYTFGFPGAVPVVVAYLGLLRQARPRLPGRRWTPAQSRALNPAQQAVANYALTRLRNKITYTNLAFALLPDRFTLSDLQHTYEVVLGRALDKRNFRKKIRSLGILAADGQARGGGRPARLYRFTGPREVVFWPAFGSSFSAVRPARAG
jgi:8-oxo-dGTP diphosphatase